MDVQNESITSTLQSYLAYGDYGHVLIALLLTLYITGTLVFLSFIGLQEEFHVVLLG